MFLKDWFNSLCNTVCMLEKMRVLKLFLLSCLFVFTITILWLSSASVNRLVNVYTDQLTIKCVLNESNDYINSNNRSCFRKNVTEEIVIAVVTCGLRATESLNMVKSALIFNTNRNPLRFIIITENNGWVPRKGDNWDLICPLRNCNVLLLSSLYSWTSGRHSLSEALLMNCCRSHSQRRMKRNGEIYSSLVQPRGCFYR